MVPERILPKAGAYTVHSHFIRNYIHQLSASVFPGASKDEKSRAFWSRTQLRDQSSWLLPRLPAPGVWEDLSQFDKKKGLASEGGTPRTPSRVALEVHTRETADIQKKQVRKKRTSPFAGAKGEDMLITSQTKRVRK